MAASGAARQRPTIWEIPDDLWLIVQHVLPREELQRSRGRLNQIHFSQSAPDVT
jgi:hypothetical protein